jgi:glycosyltransferase involved in cell wall biosynthesis
MSCVYNEEWIIGEWATVLSEMVDEIVVVDDGSRDRTVEILRTFPKVTRIHQQRPMRQTGYASREVTNRQIAHRMAREQGADWIVFLDADEMFEYGMKDRIRELVTREDVGEYHFRKLWLWRCEHLYRVDRPDKFQTFNRFRLFRDGPSVQWVRSVDVRGDNRGRVTRLGPLRLRIPPRLIRLARIATGQESLARRYQGAATVIGTPGRTETIDDLVLLHYATVSMEREVQKRLKYFHGFLSIYKTKDIEEYAAEVYALIDESGLQLAAADPAWFRLERRAEIQAAIGARRVPGLYYAEDPFQAVSIEGVRS